MLNTWDETILGIEMMIFAIFEQPYLVQLCVLVTGNGVMDFLWLQNNK